VTSQYSYLTLTLCEQQNELFSECAFFENRKSEIYYTEITSSIFSERRKLKPQERYLYHEQFKIVWQTTNYKHYPRINKRGWHS
jgi:hypothetical protein